MTELHDNCFAYRAKRKYPIHTKQATLQSYNEYLSQMQDIPQDTCNQINENFVKAASFHDIKLEDPIKPQFKRQTQVFQDSQGNKIQLTKISTITDVQHLNKQLDTNRANITFENLRKIALYGFKTGQQLGASQSVLDSLQKKAGLGIGNKQQMLSQFLKRASLIMMPLPQQQMFYRLYNSMNDQDQQTMYKKSAQICQTLHDIDKLYNLTDFYGTTLKAPQNVCCSVTVDSLLKQASDFLHIKATDAVLSKTALLQQKNKVEQFLEQYYNFKAASQQDMLNKVASLSKTAAEALIKTLE